MTPEQTLKKTESYLRNIEKAKRSSVVVGLPSDKVGGKIYGDGMTVLRVGAIHEYGAGHNPVRSFLRVPFKIKQEEMHKAIKGQFANVFDGLGYKVALGRVGAVATNISKGAFTSQGYGDWPDIKSSTKAAKDSTQVLIDTGTLRNSITWSVRDGQS